MALYVVQSLAHFNIQQPTKELPISKGALSENGEPWDSTFASRTHLDIGYSLLDIGYSPCFEHFGILGPFSDNA